MATSTATPTPSVRRRRFERRVGGHAARARASMTSAPRALTRRSSIGRSPARLCVLWPASTARLTLQSLHSGPAKGSPMAHRIIGQPIGRLDGSAKVRGEARYSADVALPGLIWGKTLRSPLPHARIVRIDTAKARALDGVLAVLTAQDLPDILVGRRMFVMPLLARDRVRFIGEKVAVVAAADPDVAEEAATLIDVEYEDLPAVIDPEVAIVAGAPVVHDNPGAYEGAPAERPHPNVQSVLRFKLG